jgi:fibronectin type 3 domain-containing protein
MLRSSPTVAESNNNELIGFIAGTVETMRDDMKSMRGEMATKEDLAGLEGRLSERLSSLDGRLSERIEVTATSIRGDIEQIHLRLDSLDHRIFQGRAFRR